MLIYNIPHEDLHIPRNHTLSCHCRHREYLFTREPHEPMGLRALVHTLVHTLVQAYICRSEPMECNQWEEPMCEPMVHAIGSLVHWLANQWNRTNDVTNALVHTLVHALVHALHPSVRTNGTEPMM